MASPFVKLRYQTYALKKPVDTIWIPYWEIIRVEEDEGEVVVVVKSIPPANSFWAGERFYRTLETMDYVLAAMEKACE